MLKIFKKLFLAPVSSLYRLITSVRNCAFNIGILSQVRVSAPVISVGNLTIGGSGKSPFARYLCEQLLCRGLKPALLSRGYGGSAKLPHRVALADSTLLVGDEPLMQKHYFSTDVEVVVSPERVAGAKYILDNKLAEVIVLDDAFQHRYLARDLNTLLIDVSSDSDIESILNDLVLPLGRLRESGTGAKSRADAMVFVRREGVEISENSLFQLKQWASGKPTFEFSLRASSCVDLFSGERVGVECFDDKNVVAVAAIGKPNSFFKLLESKGLTLQSVRAFRDHHSFSESDWSAISGLDASRTVICTEKDAVKLRPFITGPSQAFYLELFGELDRPDEFFSLCGALPRVGNLSKASLNN